ncbi:hypothetical protein CC86DRAFT_370511 [Ophiobolus disseminans]|uniref:Uncharacterized protein n=1 Tax=Ophiobolus disseminans TaxID=1469910 RepID=A0A6A7A0C0_9PLEO|nr:hypothetical protein CC86DRAFT_370511 [Ophiobolus disseminans]
MRQHDTTTTATKPERLPPDLEAARKTRINSELIEVFKRSCPVDTTPSIQGIGLYTHVAPPAPPPAPPPLFPHMHCTQKSANPVFLQIGGPARISKEVSVLEAPVSEEMKRGWKAVQEAMDTEMEHVGTTELDIGSLNERYGASHGNANSRLLPQPQPQYQQIMNHLQDIAMMGMRNTPGRVNQQFNGRTPSVGDGLNLDVAIGGVEAETRDDTSGAWAGNDYEAARDPRLRGR